MSNQRYTEEQLTASDGRVWTPEEVEMMAKWWRARDSQDMYAIESVMNKCEGFENWLDLEDPPAVDLEIERQVRESRGG